LTSDPPKKIVSLERALFLPPDFDNEKYEALSVSWRQYVSSGSFYENPRWALFIN
jgi:hypothetical protein